MSSEAKVGFIFVLVVLIAAAAGVFLGGYWQRIGTYDIYLHLADAGTVQQGADVMLSGVKIGSVAYVELKPQPAKWPGRPVVMTLALKRKSTIPNNYVFTIAQGGILASRYISIDPPASGIKSKGVLRHGQSVAGSGFRGLASLDNLAENMKSALPGAMGDLTARLNRLSERAEKTFLSQENERNIHEILRNVALMTGSANRAALNAVRLTRFLASTAESTAPATQQMIKNLNIAATNVRAVSERVNQMLTFSSLPNDINATGVHIRQAAESMDETAAAVRKLVASPEQQKRLNELTDNLARSSDNLAKLTGQAEKLLGDQQMQSDVKGTLHNLRSTSEDLSATMSHLRKVITDPQLTADLKATVHNARTLTAEGTQIGQKANRSLDRVDATMDRLGNAVSSLRPTETVGQFDFSGIRNNGLQADLDLDFYYGHRRDLFWRLGIVDLGNHERLDFQRGFRREPWTLRAGVFASRPGIGVDWAPPGGSWRVETELYDPTELTLDLGLYHSLGSNWDLSLGMKDAFRENAPFIGVRKIFPLSGSAGGGKSK